MSLSWLQLEGFTPKKLELVHNETGETETICLANDILGSDGKSITEDEVDHLIMLLLVKHQYNVLEHYKIKARIKELNQHWTIKPTPNGTVGVQQSLHERLSRPVARVFLKGRL